MSPTSLKHKPLLSSVSHHTIRWQSLSVSTNPYTTTTMISAVHSSVWHPSVLDPRACSLVLEDRRAGLLPGSVATGGGSGPIFSKLMTTPLWIFCTIDSTHCISMRCDVMAYERPGDAQAQRLACDGCVVHSLHTVYCITVLHCPVMAVAKQETLNSLYSCERKMAPDSLLIRNKKIFSIKFKSN